MAWEHEKLAWKLEMPSAKKLIFLALCDWADQHGICFPSVDAIARRGGVKERQCQRLLKELRKEGLVSVVGNEAGGARSRTYRVNLLALRKRFADDTGVKLSPVSCVTPLPVTSVRRSPVVEVTRTTSSTHQHEPPLPLEDAVAALDWSSLPQVDVAQREVVVNLLIGVDGACHQDLVDELAGALRAKAIHGQWPAWFRGLTQRARQGAFIPAQALAIRRDRERVEREAREAATRRTEAARRSDPAVLARSQAALQTVIDELSTPSEPPAKRAV